MQILICNTTIFDLGPFEVDEASGDVRNESATFPKHVLDASGAWRIADVALPDGFALGAYGIDADDALVRLPPPTLSADELAKQRAAKWEEIKVERDRRVQTGGYKVGVHWYHSDTFSRTQQIGLVMLGANIPAGTKWKTLDDGYVDMTPTLAQQIFAAAAASDIALYAAASAHKVALDASTDPANYDFSGGWPESYEGA